ncbi:MAG: DUF167 domain-containing protein [Thermodesulforhabdaceae bacterium]
MIQVRYPFITLTHNGFFLDVLIQPRSSRDELAGIHDNCLKIRLTAPPVDGAANKACIEFIAKILGVSRSRITIVSGHSSRKKRLFVEVAEPGKLIETLPL